MIVKLLTEHRLEFLSLKEAAEARPSLHLTKCQIVEISCHGSIKSRLMHISIFLNRYVPVVPVLTSQDYCFVDVQTANTQDTCNFFSIYVYVCIKITAYKMGLVTRKPVFGVSNKVRFKQAWSATETARKIKFRL